MLLYRNERYFCVGVPSCWSVWNLNALCDWGVFWNCHLNLLVPNCHTPTLFQKGTVQIHWMSELFYSQVSKHEWRNKMSKVTSAYGFGSKAKQWASNAIYRVIANRKLLKCKHFGWRQVCHMSMDGWNAVHFLKRRTWAATNKATRPRTAFNSLWSGVTLISQQDIYGISFNLLWQSNKHLLITSTFTVDATLFKA